MKRKLPRDFAHQADAVHAAMDGDFIVTTGTASGKSLCYQLPVFDALLGDGHRSALWEASWHTPALVAEYGALEEILG